jgi:2OG-Fe(II) oxygenase superfamily/Glycosyl transferase family 2
MAGELRARLGRLEELLAGGAAAPGELGRLGDAAELHRLFILELCAVLRRGPAGGPPAPGRLLAVAGETAAAGELPVATPATLRGILAGAEGTLGEAGAWAPGEPPWWAPLPAPRPLETLWERLEGRPPADLPGPDRLAAALGDPAGGAPGWLALDELLAPDLTADLFAELEAAFTNGGLPLERGGIGAAGRTSASRWDSVAYLSGCEPALLAASPRLAVTVQWLLDRRGPALAAALPGRPAAPPQTAMLARYPAPSEGYHPHLDNPGATADNGRAATLVLYLNPPGAACAGGELALWAPGAAVSAPAAAALPARGGSAVLFDSRRVAHQVRPLAPGPARWALTLWFNDASPEALGGGTGALDPPPALSVTDLLLAVPDPPLPAGTLLFHEFDARDAAGEIVVRRLDPRSRRRPPRVGLVTTAYRGGAALDAWCAHHLALGADHLLVVFDHLEEPAEAAAADLLQARHPPERLTVWSGERTAAERWPRLGGGRGTDELLGWAAAGGAAWAVAARQTLNASAALAAARTGELGGAPLDWLLHLDADELLHFEGAGRGGASLADHFGAAAAADLALLRYADHELLQPWEAGSAPRFKLNPRLAAARLGTVGWARLLACLGREQDGDRPYFHGYHNGKSAVAVAAAEAAGGVHGWRLRTPMAGASRFLAGPFILHLRFPAAAAFRAKYRAMAAAEEAPGRPFPPSPAEERAVARVRALLAAGADEETIDRRLDELYRRLTHFTPAEVEILEEAGLLLTPGLSAYTTA